MEEKRRFFGGLKSKLLMWFLVLSILPLIISSLLSYLNSSTSLQDAATNMLESIRTIKKHEIESYFAERFSDATVLSQNHMVTEGLPLFHDAFHQSGGFNSPEYKEVEKTFGKLLSDYRRAYGYYDLFLVDNDGNIVYSVTKEKDLGTNLENGPYADTSLAQAFRKSQQGIIQLADYQWYEPSNEQAAFIGARAKSVTGVNIGAVIFQVSTAHIDEVTTERAGMGETGEVYLVGADKMMRSNSRFEQESTIGKRRIDTIATNEALAGQEGTKIMFDYRNEEVLSSYAPLEIKGVKWAIISEIDTVETFAPAIALRNTMLLITVLSFIAIVFISLLISRAITTPLLLVVNRVNEIAKAAGDLTVNVPVTSKDEVGELGRAFNELMATLKGMVIKILSGSQGVSASSQQLSSAAQQTNASVDQVATAIQQLAKGSQTQAQRVEETTKVMEQLSASILQGSKSAQQAAEVSSQASKSAEKGANTVKEAITAMDKIDNATTRTSQTINKLRQRSEQITDIVTVINNVADQTNLLALNAAIEAARAGEAGRGFAVVAEEVRKLAENSGKSSTEIGKLIKVTINETEDAVKNMEVSTQEISSGKEMITRTGTALEEILSANQNVATMLQQIATASQQMSSGAEQVVKSVKDVAVIAEEASSSSQQANASTQQMAATMQEMSSSAQALAQMGIDLNAVVAEFKTGEEKTMTAPKPQVPQSRPIAPALSKRLTAARKKMAEEKRNSSFKDEKTTLRESKSDKDTREKQV